MDDLIFNPDLCLFENYHLQPQELQNVLSEYDIDSLNYEDCERLLAACDAIGYTFEYQLDGQPFNLRKIT